MTDLWMWFTDLGNSKVAALVIFFVTFVGIILYVYTNRSRSKRLESYRNVPFLDDEERIPGKKHVRPTQRDEN
ncbi:MAG: CcoQ/FixQ family Cbb3-type cytochrome c oxidase assembly chaperone [Proteobacteria bacterium]|nr:MAG: CcoQ/FixQ family Cbb3-type cytochrome c oxidase assembly chaperone [Pseudomonadota bacterium]